MEDLRLVFTSYNFTPEFSVTADALGDLDSQISSLGVFSSKMLLALIQYSTLQLIRNLIMANKALRCNNILQGANQVTGRDFLMGTLSHLL